MVSELTKSPENVSWSPLIEVTLDFSHFFIRDEKNSQHSLTQKNTGKGYSNSFVQAIFLAFFPMFSIDIINDIIISNSHWPKPLEIFILLLGLLSFYKILLLIGRGLKTKRKVVIDAKSAYISITPPRGALSRKKEMIVAFDEILGLQQVDKEYDQFFGKSKIKATSEINLVLKDRSRICLIENIISAKHARLIINRMCSLTRLPILVQKN